MTRLIRKSRKKTNKKKTLKEIKTKRTTQNLWNIAKVDLRRKFIVMQVYLKKQKESQLNN